MHRWWGTVEEFSFIAGGRLRRIEPLAAWRRLKAAGICLDDELRTVNEYGDGEAFERLVDAARAALDLLPLPASEVSDADALNALGALVAYAAEIKARFQADSDLAATYGIGVLGPISPACRFGLMLNADREELRLAARWKLAMDLQQRPTDDLWHALADTEAEAAELAMISENAREVAAILSRCRAELQG